MSVASDVVACRGPLVVVGGVLAAIVVASTADAVLALLALPRARPTTSGR